MSDTTIRDEDIEKTAFTDIRDLFPIDGVKIKTEDFLLASKGAVSLVDRFGKVFAPITYDMNGNITKLTTKYQEDERSHEYLEDMILKEKDEGGMAATDALLWLRRGLHFLTVFFRSVVEDSKIGDDLKPFIKRAYSNTLEPYHGWLGTQLFSVLSRFVPTRQSLLYKLANEKENQSEQVLEEMEIFSRRMGTCVDYLLAFYEENELESNLRI